MKPNQRASAELLAVAAAVYRQYNKPIRVAEVYTSLKYRELARKKGDKTSPSNQRKRISASFARFCGLKRGAYGTTVYLGYTITKALNKDDQIVWTFTKGEAPAVSKEIAAKSDEYLKHILADHLPEVVTLLKRAFGVGIEQGKAAAVVDPQTVEDARLNGIEEGRGLERADLLRKINGQ
jgi:hypothetical protein